MNLPSEGRPIFGIGAVARMLDLPPGTIRTWEDRYDVISPQRSEGGRRLYSRAQVDQLRFVKARVSEGVPPADAHRLLAERLAGEHGASSSPESEEPVSPQILLVERDLHAADLSRHFLRLEGYDVQVALDAETAEHGLAQPPPPLAIVELLVSVGRGAELCRRLKEQGVPAVLAVSSLAARETALAAGADAFLAKPIDPLVLVATVKNLLGAGAGLGEEEPGG